MRANTTAYCRKGVSFPDEVYCFNIFLLFNKLDVALDIDICRASYLARGVSVFQYSIYIGSGLVIMLCYCFARAELTIEMIGNIYGAYLFTFTAARTYIFVNITAVPFDISPEISCFAFKSD